MVTEPKPNDKFDAVKHVEPELISVFPEKSSYKLQIPSIQSIYKSKSKDDLKQTLLDRENLSTNKSNIRTHILITEQIADIIIRKFKNDEQVEPLDIIFSINNYLAETRITRSLTGKIKVSSNNAKELMKFLLLAHHLWNQTDEDEDYVSESDIITLCPTVICPDSVTEPDLRNQLLNHKRNALQHYLSEVTTASKKKKDSPERVAHDTLDSSLTKR